MSKKCFCVGAQNCTDNTCPLVKEYLKEREEREAMNAYSFSLAQHRMRNGQA